MKKSIFIFMVLATLLSCNKDDDNNDPNKEIEISMGNIQGKWYPSKVVLSDGSIVDYQGLCTTKNYVEIIWGGQNKIISHNYTPSELGCNHHYNEYGCSQFILLTDHHENEIIVCSYNYNGVITSLTSSTMRLELNEVQDNVLGVVYDVKGIIFSRN